MTSERTPEGLAEAVAAGKILAGKRTLGLTAVGIPTLNEDGTPKVLAPLGRPAKDRTLDKR